METKPSYCNEFWYSMETYSYWILPRRQYQGWDFKLMIYFTALKLYKYKMLCRLETKQKKSSYIQMLVGWLYWGFTSLQWYFSHIATWKQEITNLWKFKCEAGNRTTVLLLRKPIATTQPPLLPYAIHMNLKIKIEVLVQCTTIGSGMHLD